MDYLLEGIGNELFLMVFAYFVFTCISILLKFLKFRPYMMLTERSTELWQSIRNTIFRDDLSVFPNRTTEDENNDLSLDVRIFNTDCCVCLREDCHYPVTSACGHCFCGMCALNLIECSSVPMKCPLCRQECRALFLPFPNQQTTDDSLHDLVFSSITSYNSRAEHRSTVRNMIVNRVRNAPVMLQHLVRSFVAVQVHVMFRLKCHVIAAVIGALGYLILPIDIIPDEAFGLIGFIDDLIVLIFLMVWISRTYSSFDSSVSLEDIRAALE